jgi:hypothetical protein
MVQRMAPRRYFLTPKGCLKAVAVRLPLYLMGCLSGFELHGVDDSGSKNRKRRDFEPRPLGD